MAIKRKQKEGFRAIFGNLEISHLEGTIIASFFPEADEMTIREIQERVDYSYERVNSALKSLTEKKIVKEDRKGKTLVYSLDVNSLYSYSPGFNSYMLYRKIEFIKKHRTIYKAIQEIENHYLSWSVVLFGSYSKETETNQSDVDILILAIPSKEKEIEHFIKSLKHKYGINFASIVLPMHEFIDIKKDNLELWNDLKLYGIVFKGDDTFYYWMYKSGKN
ncbi:MAG: nucleotidyltransferase domain-containing protein [Nanoarchaeota archaeon]